MAAGSSFANLEFFVIWGYIAQSMSVILKWFNNIYKGSLPSRREIRRKESRWSWLKLKQTFAPDGYHYNTLKHINQIYFIFMITAEANMNRYIFQRFRPKLPLDVGFVWNGSSLMCRIELYLLIHHNLHIIWKEHPNMGPHFEAFSWATVKVWHIRKSIS